METKVILTGITGFVGSHLACHLIKQFPDIQILGFTRKNIKSASDLSAQQKIACQHQDISLDEYMKRVEHFQCDISEFDCKIPEKFSGSQVLFHVAAQINENVGEEKMRACNRLGTENVTQLCQNYNVGSFLFISSIAAHHEPLQHLPYYKTKREAEEVIKEKLKNYNILIPGIILGAGDLLKDTRGIYRTFLDKILPILPPGRSNITDVHDLCDVSIELGFSDSFGNSFFVGHILDNISAMFRQYRKHAKYPNLPSIQLPKLSWPSFYAVASQDYNYPDTVPEKWRKKTPLSLADLVAESVESYRSLK